MEFSIFDIQPTDHDAITNILNRYWGSDIVVVQGKVFYPAEMDGIKATQNNKIIGILHYQIVGSSCEIMTLASLKENNGVGTSLIEAVEKIAEENGCKELKLTTTNDNLHALGFYQRRGFLFSKLLPGQVKHSRQLKPSIPEIGYEKIPIRDEIILSKPLDNPNND